MSSLPIQNCFYCGAMRLEKGEKVTIEKMVAKTLTNITTVSCLSCTEKKELKFTMADLSEASDVPFEELKNYACIANSFSELFSENIPDSEKKAIMIGLVDRYRCMICLDLIGATEKIADHVAQCHSEEETFECKSGCGLYLRQTDMESHKEECGILCPDCDEKFAVDTGHFLSVHPCVMCQFHGCTTAFELKKKKNKEGEDDVINDLLKHIIASHVWKKDEYADTD